MSSWLSMEHSRFVPSRVHPNRTHKGFKIHSFGVSWVFFLFFVLELSQMAGAGPARCPIHRRRDGVSHTPSAYYKRWPPPNFLRISSMFIITYDFFRLAMASKCQNTGTATEASSATFATWSVLAVFWRPGKTELAVTTRWTRCDERCTVRPERHRNSGTAGNVM